MKLTLTTNELVQLGNVALRTHKLTGIVLEGVNVKLDPETLLKTDRELLDEAVQDAIADIKSVGGSVEKTIEGHFVVELPEYFMVEALKSLDTTLKVSSPFVVKAIKFADKYKDVFKKLFGYIKSIACTFGPIFEAAEVKDIQKDFDAVVAEFERVQAELTTAMIDAEKRVEEGMHLNNKYQKFCVEHDALVSELEHFISIKAHYGDMLGAMRESQVRALRNKCCRHFKFARHLAIKGVITYKKRDEIESYIMTLFYKATR